MSRQDSYREQLTDLKRVRASLAEKVANENNGGSASTALLAEAFVKVCDRELIAIKQAEDNE